MRFATSFTWTTVLLASLALAQDPAPVKLDLACSKLEDCPPTFCIGGGAVGSCTDGKCVCGSPQAPPEPTQPPKKPECFHQNAVPNQYTSAFCRCNLDSTTKTLAEMTVEGGDLSQSCDYMTMPTGTENPVTQSTATYTLPCRICEGVGGLEFHSESNCKAIPGCEIPGPLAGVWLADTSVSLGMALNGNDGKDLAGKLASGLKGQCLEYDLDNDKMKNCTTTEFDVGEIPAIIDQGYEPMILKAHVTRSRYNSTSTRDWLIEKAIAGLILGAQKNCGQVPYEEGLVPGKSGCAEHGTYGKRDITFSSAEAPPRDGFMLKARVDPGGISAMKPDKACKYMATMCNGPEHVEAILGKPSDPIKTFMPADPYKNQLQVNFRLTRQKLNEGFSNPWAQWACETTVGGIGDALTSWMPTGLGEGTDLAVGGTDGAVEPFKDLAMEVYCGSSDDA